ncbi:MAG: hypothetical protein AVDCRST_MAG33-1916, partial [uncultured Thermomicrobiales bacterium]
HLRRRRPLRPAAGGHAPGGALRVGPGSQRSQRGRWFVWAVPVPAEHLGDDPVRGPEHLRPGGQRQRGRLDVGERAPQRVGLPV